MKKLLTKSLIFLLISGLITKVILYLIDVVIAREYGVSTFGIYSLADSFLSILILFADFGLNSFILAKYHDLKTSNIFDLFKVSILKTLLSFISFLLILSLGFWKFNYVPANEIYFILAFNFILTSFNNFIFFYFRAILIPAYETVVRSLGFIITFLVIFFLKPFGISLELFLLFLVLIQVLTLLINTFILFKKKEPVKSTVSLK